MFPPTPRAPFRRTGRITAGVYGQTRLLFRSGHSSPHPLPPLLTYPTRLGGGPPRPPLAIPPGGGVQNGCACHRPPPRRRPTHPRAPTGRKGNGVVPGSRGVRAKEDKTTGHGWRSGVGRSRGGAARSWRRCELVVRGWRGGAGVAAGTGQGRNARARVCRERWRSRSLCLVSGGPPEMDTLFRGVRWTTTSRDCKERNYFLFQRTCVVKRGAGIFCHHFVANFPKKVLMNRQERYFGLRIACVVSHRAMASSASTATRQSSLAARTTPQGVERSVCVFPPPRLLPPTYSL